MIVWDLLITDSNVATMCGEDGPYGIVEDGALAISDGCIAWVGPTSDLPNIDARANAQR